MSRWNDEAVRDLAQALRGERNKGVRRALRRVKHDEACARNARTPAGRRKRWRLAGKQRRAA
jgi:hypothetical protein